MMTTHENLLQAGETFTQPESFIVGVGNASVIALCGETVEMAMRSVTLENGETRVVPESLAVVGERYKYAPTRFIYVAGCDTGTVAPLPVYGVSNHA